MVENEPDNPGSGESPDDSLSGEPASDDALPTIDSDTTRGGLSDFAGGPGVPAGPVAHPETIASYKIVRVIGEGGMGTTYEAWQATPHRRVAVKVVKASRFTEAARKRFAYEAEILARLAHPGIAQIYEAGMWTDADGVERPFMAMEYIDGQSLHTYLDRSELDTKAMLSLFRLICEAVHYSHQRGVIHRDLKPDNILIQKDGRPKVIDFGVARVTDSDMHYVTQQTNVGALIGTLQYMSPEQVEYDTTDLDTRSDVYALGVILYEMLCGAPPYDLKERALHEAVRVICEDAPVNPSTYHRYLRGDMETITLKAMEKNRNRRYGSAEELSNDIRRHLEGMPIEAARPTTFYRLRKFVHRHRLGTVIAALLVLSSMVGLVAAWQWSRADAARLERNRMVAELIDFYMVDHYQAISRLAGSQAARELIIERSMEYLQQLRQDAVDDADLQLILSEGLQAVGNNHWSMRMGSRGRLAEAVLAWEQSMAAIDTLLQDAPGTTRYVMPAISVRTLLFNGYHRLGRAEEAGVILARAHVLLESLGDAMATPKLAHLSFHVWVDRAEHVRRGGVDPSSEVADEMELLVQTLSHAAAMRSRWPNVNSIRRDESIARNRLGGLHARRGEHEAAIGQYQQSLQLREARLKDEPEGNTEQRDVMNSRRYVAQSLIKLNRTDAALGTYADSILPMARSLREQNRNADGSTDQRAVRDLALVLREYGDVLVVVARHGEAVAPLVESFGLWEGLADATPDDLDLAWDAGRAGGSLAAVHVSMDQVLDARIVLDRVQRRLDRGFRRAPDHARLKQVQAYCDSLRGAL